ncbi:MAG TPA: type II toxin-antitoxin system HipA family toxin [Stenomitos sp.]
MRQLSVRMYGLPQAVLEQDDSGRMRMTYLPEATRPLSMSLPLRDEPYVHASCEAYFGGLLPESDAARRMIARFYGANANNSFSLLKAIGNDCAGAVSLHLMDDPVSPSQFLPMEGRPLSEAELAKHLRELPSRPLFLGVEGIRLSLAGAQDKAAVCMMDDQLALPLHGTPTTHILKPAVAGFKDMVLNEYLCLKLAQEVGLEVPAVEMRKAEDIPYLLVERYDRVVDPEHRLSRVHQEDFCQALGASSAMKYEADGGPGVAQCFGLVRRTSRPAVSIKRLLEHLLFNVLVGNCDAHAKNYSLLHREDGRIDLAPAYDVVCTRYYPDIEARMAMKIGGYYRSEELIARRWRRFCDEVDVSFPMLRRTLTGMNEAIQTAIERVIAVADWEGSGEILGFIAAHAASVVNRLEQSET